MHDDRRSYLKTTLVSFVIEVFLERVLILLMLFGFVFRQQLLALLADHFSIVLVRRHHERGQLAFEILAVAFRALGRAAGSHQRLEFVAARAALVVVQWHGSPDETGRRHPAGGIPLFA